MLSKLIKHEFRATSRIMWPVFLGMLALTALMRFSQLLLNGGHIPWLLQLIGVLLVIGFMVGLGALAFAPLVLSAVRWRDHVLKDEGYLTLTLPVSLHQLLISKLIVSAVWYAAAFIVGLLSLLIAVSGWSTFQYVPDFFNDVFTAFFEMEASLRSHALLIVFELFCNFVFAVSAASLVVYAAYSIGYSFNKHKELWTVILILVFFQLAQFTAIAMIGAFFNRRPHALDESGRLQRARKRRAAVPLGDVRRAALRRGGLRRDVVLHDEKTESRVTHFLKKQPRRASAFPAAFLHPFYVRISQNSKIMSTCDAKFIYLKGDPPCKF